MKNNKWLPIKLAPRDGTRILIVGGFPTAEVGDTDKERTLEPEISNRAPDKAIPFWITGGTDYCYGQKDPLYFQYLPEISEEKIK